MPKQTGLGRGLGALLPKQKPATKPAASSPAPKDAAPGGLLSLDPQDIVANPSQPRQSFSEKAIGELASSIKEYGILEPLLVCPAVDGKYELIAGERRLRAAREAGLGQVPAIVHEAEGQRRLEIALVENIQRKDLNPVEEALAYQELMEEFSLTQEQVAKRVGKSRPAVANTLRILSLPQKILDAISQEKISEGHARAIAALETEAEQMELFKRITSAKLNVRDAEEYVQSYKRQRKGGTPAKDPEIVEQQRVLEEKFSTRVKIQKRKGKGKISIEFYSEEEFSNIMGEMLS